MRKIVPSDQREKSYSIVKNCTVKPLQVNRFWKPLSQMIFKTYESMSEKHNKGPSIKSINNVRSQEGGGLSSADILWTKGGSSSCADVRIFWCKNVGFFEIYGVSARTKGEEGWASVRDFVLTSFMDGL